MARNIKFVRSHKGVREELLLSAGAVPIEAALVGRADAVKPPGTDVFVSRTYGPQGRVVVHIVDRNQLDAKTAKGRRMQRRWMVQALQQAINRIPGRFRKGRGRKLGEGEW